MVSVDFATGGDRIVHTEGPGLKINPQILPDGTVAYYLKGIGMDTDLRETDLAWMNYERPQTGLYYTAGVDPLFRALRSPCWSPDGKKVVYEKVNFSWRAQGKPLHSWTQTGNTARPTSFRPYRIRQTGDNGKAEWQFFGRNLQCRRLGSACRLQGHWQGARSDPEQEGFDWGFSVHLIPRRRMNCVWTWPQV
ncbi:hypothetical protein [Pelagibacterium luteolum]|uniref:WD40-like Beta Propeller Repeat n=1 Tax=Pelagibacterium luteolum TaxID=440168 RepID=A0A1G8ALR6_9HYPH|nr:hypothetical protein [Pelagibacterium luteolum]SDH21874.1 hypothetical protein SAMN04487974_13310 [Pelagibacterium luteolum]